MCWAFRFAENTVMANNPAIATPHAGRITRAGKDAALLVREGDHLGWESRRYGISFPKVEGGSKLIWNARDDKIDKVETWYRLIRQRFAVPIDAYVESTPRETWHVGDAAWAVGIYSVTADGGAVIVTESDGSGGRRPILLDAEHAIAWIRAEQWDAMPHLHQAPRMAFRKADLFETKRLEADARSKVPLPRAA